MRSICFLKTQPLVPRERIKVAGGGELSTVDHVTKDSLQSLDYFSVFYHLA